LTLLKAYLEKHKVIVLLLSSPPDEMKKKEGVIYIREIFARSLAQCLISVDGTCLES
jgi:hypothetical protein